MNLEGKTTENQGLEDLHFGLNCNLMLRKKRFVQGAPSLFGFCNPVLSVFTRASICLNLCAHMFVIVNQLQLVGGGKSI